MEISSDDAHTWRSSKGGSLFSTLQQCTTARADLATACQDPTRSHGFGDSMSGYKRLVTLFTQASCLPLQIKLCSGGRHHEEEIKYKYIFVYR
jgi:hypothetical protein